MLNPILFQPCPKCGTELDLNTHNTNTHTTNVNEPNNAHSYGRVCHNCNTKLDIVVSVKVSIHEFSPAANDW